MTKKSNTIKILLALLSILLISGITYFSYFKIEQNNRFLGAYDLYKINDSFDIKTLEPLSESNHAKSSVMIGLYHLKNGDTTKAMVLFQKAINDGDKIYGSLNLASCSGDKFLKLWWMENFKKALDLAEDGDWMMQWKIANAIYKGHCVGCKDTALAFKLLGESANLGFTRACLMYGVWNEDGIGTKVNEIEAFKWYKKAADKGNNVGQAIIGYYFTTGKGGQKISYSDALKYYKLSAAQGNSSAQIALAFMYKLGLGVTADINESLKWAKIASDNGLAVGTEFIENYNKEQEAQRLANQNIIDPQFGTSDMEIQCPKCEGRQVLSCYTCNGEGQIHCNGCDGDGWDEDGRKCLNCRGKGILTCPKRVSCSACNGYGYGYLQVCVLCNGSGKNANGEECQCSLQFHNAIGNIITSILGLSGDKDYDQNLKGIAIPGRPGYLFFPPISGCQD